MQNSPVTTKAIVCYSPSNTELAWKLDDIDLRSIEDDELIVSIVASGICHTDLTVGGLNDPSLYPRVVGHEGVGYVKKVGSEVKEACPGDPVLLSFAHCGVCKSCQNGESAWCREFSSRNAGRKRVFMKHGEEVRGFFFGQSSFAHTTIVHKSSVVNLSGVVKTSEELALLAPLGCGLMTGSATISSLAKVGPSDKLVIIGLGAVGMAAIMTASIVGCEVIIGIDRVASRLKRAISLGATSVIDTTDPETDVVTDVLKNTDGEGASVVMDASGVPALIQAGIKFTAKRGQMILVGIPPPTFNLSLALSSFLSSGNRIYGSIEGGVDARQYVPQMINWYREGKFPIDELVTFYKAADFLRALEDMKNGITIKPVLVW